MDLYGADSCAVRGDGPVVCSSEGGGGPGGQGYIMSGQRDMGQRHRAWYTLRGMQQVDLQGMIKCRFLAAGRPKGLSILN